MHGSKLINKMHIDKMVKIRYGWYIVKNKQIKQCGYSQFISKRLQSFHVASWRLVKIVKDPNIAHFDKSLTRAFVLTTELLDFNRLVNLSLLSLSMKPRHPTSSVLNMTDHLRSMRSDIQTQAEWRQNGADRVLKASYLLSVAPGAT